MSRELWDVYSFDRRPTGRTMYRGDPIPEGAFHLVVHICVFSPDGHMLNSSAGRASAAGRASGT